MMYEALKGMSVEALRLVMDDAKRRTMDGIEINNFAYAKDQLAIAELCEQELKRKTAQ